MNHNRGIKPVQIIRWIARVAAVLAAGLILLFFLGEGIAGGGVPLTNLTPGETLMMVPFFAV